jgi:phytoene dehydrogenase-like protein
MTHHDTDVAVIGGGLGGLAAAALLARRGLRAVVLERASRLGGRAATDDSCGFSFNMGAHALYRGGAAARVLRGIGVAWTGRPPPRGGLAVLGDRTYGLPTTVGAMLSTGLLGWSAKTQGARLFARIRSSDARALDEVTLQSWLAGETQDATLRRVFETFVRVSTYANAPGLLSAGAAIQQLRLAQDPGVEYVDGGWQTLVAGAAGAARAAGAAVRTDADVSCASRIDRGWRVHVHGGSPIDARALVLATGPRAACSVVASEALASWASRAVPLRAACLDVALARLPDERATFALGVDRPLYLSVHSRTARLAPDGAALVSTMKYLSPSEPSDAALDRAELEAWLDRLQPGWRDVLVERRWLPAMTTVNAAPAADRGGVRGRPGPRVPDAPGAYVVGDWVGPEGMLLDASLASAERAAEHLSREVLAAGQPREAVRLRWRCVLECTP